MIVLDGGQHLESGGYDKARTIYLNDRGFSVMRFWNNQVLSELDGALEAILLALTR